MKTNWFKRTLCSILAFAMVLGYVPATAFASEADGLCEHHTQHTKECGYSPAVEAHDCGHVHTEECYQSVTECVHSHGDCGYVPAVEGQSCDCQPDENGEIVHTEGCGYVEAVAEVPCGHVCSEETGCVTKMLNCQHKHDVNCGFVEYSSEIPCNYTCSRCNDGSTFSADQEFGFATRTPVLTISGWREVTQISVGSNFGLRGTISTDCGIIEYVTGSILKSDGTVICTHTDTPETSTYDIQYGINKYLVFGTLSEGYYYIDIQAEANYYGVIGTQTLIHQQFVVGNPSTGAPTAPTNFTATYVDNERAFLSWSPSIGATSYEVQYWSPTNSTWLDDDSYSSGTSYTSKGLKNYSSWQFRVRAVNSVGASGWTNCSYNKSATTITGNCGINGTNLTYTLSSDGILTIRGNGAMADYTNVSPDGTMGTPSPWYSDRGKITRIIIESGVTSIGTWAFYNCTNATSVSIPSSVTTFGEAAFFGCSGLTEVTIPSSITELGNLNFAYCTSLSSISLPDNLQAIGDVAFMGCSQLNSVSIPHSVSLIGCGSFQGCTSLTSVNIPESVTSIGAYSFYHCSGLKDVYYSGTEERWKAITIEENNEPLTNATIHYGAMDSDVQPEPKYYTGEFQYPSAFLTKDTGTVIASYPYRFGDDWLESDSTQYDHAIARTAIRFAMAGYGVPLTGYSTNISKLLYELEFKNIQSEYPYPGPDTIGYIIGSKRVQFDDGIKTIVVVVVRGGGYRYEWASNFTVGTGDEHQGFSEAASTVYDGLLAYFEKNNILPDSNVKVLVTGYSRAAATTNLVAARIDDAIANNTLSLAKQNVFAYCFECPQTTRSTSSQSSRYQNIHCIVNDVDLVTKVAPSGWKYSRYGKTYHLPSAEYYGADYLPAKERMINQYRDILNEANAPYSDEELLNTVNEISGQGAFLDSYLGKLCRYISFPTIFSQVPYITDDYQSVLRAVGATMGETEGEKSWLTGLSIAVEAIVGLPKLAPFAALHPIDTAKIASSAYLGCIGGAHYAELCLAWMDAISGDMLKESVTSYRMRVNCPVDIEVYDSSNVLVAKIVNDEVIDVGGYIGAYIDEDGQKVIILPGNDTFDVRYLATDNGTMSCQVEEHDADGGTIELTNFYDIPIAKNDILSGTVSPEQGISIADPEQNEIQPDQILSDNQIEYYSVSVSANGPGEVIGGGVITVGQFVKVTANPNEGAQFVKWCDESGETLSTDAVFRLCVTRDTNLVAVFAAGTENRNRIDNIDSIVGESPQVWIDGVCYPVQSDTTGKYVTIHDDAHTMVTYSYNNPNAADVHTKYPIGMKVWKLKQENGVYTAEYVPEFDNLLQYSGSSIRITGNKGIRMITSVNQDTRNALTGNGLAGFKLLEYGTLLAQTSKLGDNPLVLGGGEYVKSNYAYKKGVADPVFKYTNGLIQYTNVLIGFTDEQCKEDIAMRPYMKLLDENGEEVVIYGGIVYRSIGYIAYQNRNAFQPGSAAYEYVWSIIHNVYGNQYDSEYKK